MSAIKPVYGFCARLCEPLDQTGVGLPISLSDFTHLSDQVQPGEHVNLILSNGGYTEIVRFTGAGVIIRAQEQTVATAWPAGTRVLFDWTAKNLGEWMACVAETMLDDSQSDSSSETEQVCGVDNEGFEWFSCNYRFFIKDGQIHRAQDPNYQPDGVFSNATVTVKNGKPTFSKGCPVIYESDCGGCDKCGASVGECACGASH